MKTVNKNDMPLVSVIILNYNGKSDLIKCLDSLRKTDYPNLETIVVDNGSTDNSVSAVQQMFENVKVLSNEINYGYAKGNNIGIQNTHGEYVVLLNNDTFVHPNWLKQLVEAAEKLKEDCFLQPKILLADNPQIINSAGNMIHVAGFGFPRGAGERDMGQYEREAEVAYASGACIFTSQRVIRKVGLLDERYFLQFEDLDWGWRGRMQGITSRYIPKAVIYHKWGGTLGRFSEEKSYYLERNRVYTLLTNYSIRTLIILFPVIAVTEVLVLIYSLANKRLSAKIKSYSDLIRIRQDIIKRRHLIQKGREKPDKDVLSVFSDILKHPHLKSPAIQVANVLFSRLWHVLHRYI